MLLQRGLERDVTLEPAEARTGAGGKTQAGRMARGHVHTLPPALEQE